MRLDFSKALTTIAFLVFSLVPALAADVIYPATLRVGLVPPPGFVLSQRFPGFEHNDRAIGIILTELPGYTYDAIEKEVSDDLQKSPGLLQREAMDLAGGARGFLLKGTQTSPQGPLFKWTMVVRQHGITGIAVVEVPDAVKEFAPYETILAALQSLSVRPAVPVEEQLAALPFAMNDLAGYRIVRVQPGNAAMLTEGEKDAVEVTEQPLVMITIGPMPAPPAPHERDSVARRLMAETPALKDMRVTRAEPLRIANQQGYEVQADAKDVKTGTDLKAVQWIRFGSGTVMRIIAIASKDAWEANYPRFRQLRDGIGPK